MSSFPGEDTPSDASEDANEDYAGTVLSSSKVNLTVNDSRGTLPPGTSEVTKQPEKNVSHGRTSLGVDSHRQFKDRTSETVWSDELTSFLSSTTSTLKDQEDEDLQESSLKDVYDETDMPMSEDKKPSPLAGANVMNVILVAAECAPWSKTGN